MIGMGFVFLYYYEKLPMLFALMAGLGDAIAAIGAYFLGMRLVKRQVVPQWQKTVWNSFGLLDFVLALATGVITRTMWNGGITSEPMGDFPLAMIPGFAVPFFVITHLILILKWRDEKRFGQRD